MFKAGQMLHGRCRLGNRDRSHGLEKLIGSWRSASNHRTRWVSAGRVFVFRIASPVGRSTGISSWFGIGRGTDVAPDRGRGLDGLWRHQEQKVGGNRSRRRKVMTRPSKNEGFLAKASATVFTALVAPVLVSVTLRSLDTVKGNVTQRSAHPLRV